MIKTRSQVLRITVKEEECEDKHKLEQLLHGTNNKSNSKSTITKDKVFKTKPVKTESAIVKPEPVIVKPENTNENKATLSTTRTKTTSRRSRVTNEQVKQLINYIVNDGMTLEVAARKARMSKPTASEYYKQYKNDTEHNIPLAKSGSRKRLGPVTQEKIEHLIHYIIYDKMTLTQAADRARISRPTAAKYYTKYNEDPNHEIPVPVASTHSVRPYQSKRCTNEKVELLICYIVNDGMTLLEASKKVNMCESTAKKYYQKYLDDPDHIIPTLGSRNRNGQSHKRPTLKKPTLKKPALDQIRQFFSYVIIGKLTVTQASSEANISESLGQQYYKKYLTTSTVEDRNVDSCYSVKKMKKMIEYMRNGNMDLKLASKTVNLNLTTAQKYYEMYLKDRRRRIPILKYKRRQNTHDDMKRLVDYVENGNMNVYCAARKLKMSPSTAHKYYKAYKNDPEGKIIAPRRRGMRQRKLDKYSKVIANIYKNNPSIKPIQERYFAEPGSSGIDSTEKYS